MESLPLYSEDLIKELVKEIPHKCPDLRESEREIFFYAGKRDLIDNLLVLLERAQKGEEEDDNEETKNKT